jgi:hypothetical protein
MIPPGTNASFLRGVAWVILALLVIAGAAAVFLPRAFALVMCAVLILMLGANAYYGPYWDPWGK